MHVQGKSYIPIIQRNRYACKTMMILESNNYIVEQECIEDFIAGLQKLKSKRLIWMCTKDGQTDKMTTIIH